MINQHILRYLAVLVKFKMLFQKLRDQLNRTRYVSTQRMKS